MVLTIKTHHIPLIYRLFFGYIEPFESIMGGYITHFQSHTYYTLNAGMSPAAASLISITPATQIILSQLGTMYVGFGLVEIIFTRLVPDIRLWKLYVLALVISDALYLWSMRPLGKHAYWRADTWNTVTWGDFGLLYLGALIRLGFLAGWGVREVRKAK